MTSPLIPCGLITSPILTRSSCHPEFLPLESRAILFHDFKPGSLIDLACCSRKQGPHRPGCSTLLADHLTQIFFCYRQFNNYCVILFSFPNLDLIRIINQGGRNIMNQLLHTTFIQLQLFVCLHVWLSGF